MPSPALILIALSLLAGPLYAQKKDPFSNCIQRRTQHSGCRIGAYHEHPNGVCKPAWSEISFIIDYNKIGNELRIDSIRAGGVIYRIEPGKGRPNRKVPGRQLVCRSPYGQFHILETDSSFVGVKAPDQIWFRLNAKPMVQKVVFQQESRFQAPPP